MSKPSKNYLNNKDILKEIHKSKITYSVYESAYYQDYDGIVSLPLDGCASAEIIIPLLLNDEFLSEAKQKHIERLLLPNDTEVKLTDLVFRIMTYDHIPQVFKPVSLDTNRPVKKRPSKKSQKSPNKLVFEQLFSSDFEIEVVDKMIENIESLDEQIEEYVGFEKVNFAPYQHVIFTDESHTNLKCVGKSHWTGDLVSGKFCPDKGQMTPTFAKMLLLLCQRIGTKFNWRGYTYVEDMQSSAALKLVQVALKFNEAKSQNPFAFYTTIINNEFMKILNEEKTAQSIRDDLLELNGLNPSWTRQMSATNSGTSQHE